MLKSNILIIVTVSLVIAFSSKQVCAQDLDSIVIPHYLNQAEYDSVLHLIYQNRSLILDLVVDNPKNTIDQSFTINTSWGEDSIVTQQFSEDGNFSKEINYSESKIDIEIPLQYLNPNEDLESIVYHWFHPNQWFKSLKLDVFTEHLSAKYKPSKKRGLIEIEMEYPPHLKKIEADGSFGTMLGWQIDLTGKYKNVRKMYWIKRKGSRKLVAIADLRNFFKENNDNYSTPFKVGDKYELQFSLILELRKSLPSSKKSNKQDPVYKPRNYHSSKITGRGNPYVDIPKITPHYQIIINTSKEVIIQPEHLDF